MPTREVGEHRRPRASPRGRRRSGLWYPRSPVDFARSRGPPPLPTASAAARSLMTFDVGDKVVYPHHGAATIERREKKEAFGEKRDYLVLRLAYGDLTLMVPADNAEEIGLREVINDEEVEEVFAVLRKKEARMPTNWSRRFKNHVEKLKSGDIYQVAE